MIAEMIIVYAVAVGVNYLIDMVVDQKYKHEANFTIGLLGPAVLVLLSL